MPIQDYEKFGEFLDYLFKFYLTEEHPFGVFNQDHFNSIMNGDNDGTNNSSETVNRAFKRVAAESKCFHSIIRNIHEFKILQNRRQIELESGATIRIRKNETIARYNTVKSMLVNFEKLSPARQHNELTCWLQNLGSV